MQWAYWNEDPCCARPHEGLLRSLGAGPDGPGNVKLDKLAVLARPYPRAVAGVPERWSWDPSSRTFEAAWRTRPAGDRAAFPRGTVTEVELPPAALGGYRATVTGGKVVSRRRARILRIANDRGAQRVELTVAPPPA